MSFTALKRREHGVGIVIAKAENMFINRSRGLTCKRIKLSLQRSQSFRTARDFDLCVRVPVFLLRTFPYPTNTLETFFSNPRSPSLLPLYTLLQPTNNTTMLFPFRCIQTPACFICAFSLGRHFICPSPTPCFPLAILGKHYVCIVFDRCNWTFIGSSCSF